MSKPSAGDSRSSIAVDLRGCSGRLRGGLIKARTRRKVEADDPARNRCGCFLPDLTRLATAPSADFRASIWGQFPPPASLGGAVRESSCNRRSPLHPPFTATGRRLKDTPQGNADAHFRLADPD